MLDLNKLGIRIDVEKAAMLIAISRGKDKPVSKKTVWDWVSKGWFPKQIDTPSGAAVWDTKQCMEALRLEIKKK